MLPIRLDVILGVAFCVFIGLLFLYIFFEAVTRFIAGAVEFYWTMRVRIEKAPERARLNLEAKQEMTKSYSKSYFVKQ
jgi:hypothetical protein